jgi:hypothetical protein
MTLNEYIVYFVDNRHMAKEDPYFPSQFNAIAIVQANSLDKVFELCNSFDLGDSAIDSHWSHNGSVTLLGYAKENTHNLRSMSVGDVLLDITHHRTYKILPSGWKQLSGEENETNGLLTVEEETELNKQFVKDNFCPSDKDPLTYEPEYD